MTGEYPYLASVVPQKACSIFVRRGQQFAAIRAEEGDRQILTCGNGHAKFDAARCIPEPGNTAHRGSRKQGPVWTELQIDEGRLGALELGYLTSPFHVPDADLAFQGSGRGPATVGAEDGVLDRLARVELP